MTELAMGNVHSTTYDRTACDIGVVHLGFGAFHRAHQAVFIDDYMDATGDLRWGIAAVNLRSEESADFAAHSPDNVGYVIQSFAPDGETAMREVRSHVAFLDWSKARSQAEDLLTFKTVHAVTITVTESGYYLDENGNLNPEDAVIAQELSGQGVRTVYAYLATALGKRMMSSAAPLTIMCCDNIRQNGKMLKRNLDRYLRLKDQIALADWVKDNVTFPCSMVDRITPRCTQAVRDEVEALIGPQPVPPIMAEAFIQWVLANDFAGPMPALDKVGVTITDLVDPYEDAKIRILNGGHTGLTYLAALKGITTFDEAMRDPELLAHFLAFEEQEVLPGLTIALPFDKSDYLRSITDRFGNRAIGDTVARICADGMSKFPIFIRPTLESCLAQGIMPVHGIKSIASWYVFARHVAADRIPFDYVEPNWQALEPMLSDTGRDAFIHSTQLWGDLPKTYPEFAEKLALSITELEVKWPA